MLRPNPVMFGIYSSVLWDLHRAQLGERDVRRRTLQESKQNVNTTDSFLTLSSLNYREHSHINTSSRTFHNFLMTVRWQWSQLRNVRADRSADERKRGWNTAREKRKTQPENKCDIPVLCLKKSRRASFSSPARPHVIDLLFCQFVSNLETTLSDRCGDSEASAWCLTAGHLIYTTRRVCALDSASTLK